MGLSGGRQTDDQGERLITYKGLNLRRGNNRIGASVVRFMSKALLTALEGCKGGMSRMCEPSVEKQLVLREAV